MKTFRAESAAGRGLLFGRRLFPELFTHCLP